MALVIPAQETPTVAVAGAADRFPVRRIFCVGRNYAAHTAEMGHDAEKEPPFFFAKPADAVVDHGATIPYPPDTADLHHEGELVVAIGRGGRDIAAADAPAHVWGWAAGNDLTRRDLQAAAKAARRPWDWAKGFDRSAVIGPVTPAAQAGDMSAGAIRALVNGEVRQSGDLADMIWDVPSVIAFVSRSIEIRPGDLIMTGTPAGVGPLVPGDLCRVEIDGLAPAETRIGPPG